MSRQGPRLLGLLVLAGLGAWLPRPAAAQSRPAAMPSPAVTGPAEAKPSLGVWLTTVDSAVLYEPSEAATALRFLQEQGFRRAALPLYTAGTVLWSPAADRNRLAIPLDPRLAAGATAGLLQALGRSGLERVGWFEFGLMAPAGAPWLAGRDDLLLRDRFGGSRWQESPSLDRVWLNPLLPEVQQLLEDLVVDACTRLPLEAIQFDDHLGYPAAFGYDPTTLKAWRATAAGQRLATPAADHPAWIAWRAEQVTALLLRLRRAMANACPAVRLSVSPNPQEFSRSSYLADWSAWVRQGLVDEVVVQIYRQNLAALERELRHPSLAEAARRVPVRIGLLAGLRSQPKDPALLKRELALVRQRGYRGIDLFFYESARQHFSEVEAPRGVPSTPAPAQPPAPAASAGTELPSVQLPGTQLPASQPPASLRP